MAARAQIGGVDPFNASGGPNAAVRAMAAQSDGKIIVVGDFTSISSVSRNRIARVNPDGTLDPNFALGAAANGAIYAVALQSNGKILIGGSFTSYDGVTRNKVARLNVDGSLDTTFDPGVGPNGTVYTLAVNGYNGFTVLIGGDFTSVSGQTRNRFAQLSFAGSLDTYYFSNAAGADGIVYAILSTNSNIYVGGAFTHFNGSTRNALAMLNGYDGTLNTSFNAAASAGPDGTVYTMAYGSSASSSPFTMVSSSGLYIGGDFTAVSGAAHTRLAEVDASSGSPVAAFTFSANGPVRRFSIQNGTINNLSALEVVVAGDFTQINATPCSHVARLVNTAVSSGSSSTAWSLDSSFDVGSGANASVLCLLSQTDGKTILGGQFTSLNGNARNYLGRLYGDGGSAPPVAPSKPTAGAGTDTQLIVVWSTASYASGHRIERSPDGVNGWTQVNPVVGFTATPFIDSGLSPGTICFYRVRAYSTNGEGAPSAVVSAATLPAPWTAAGAVDAVFTANAGPGLNGTVKAIALQADGKILLAGDFFPLGGGRKYLARLNSDGSVDASFNIGSGPNSSVEAIAIQSDGKILIGGYFSAINGTARQYLARLNPDGSLDPSLALASSTISKIDRIAVQIDGQIVLAGEFSVIGGASRNGIARLNSDGSLDTSFNPGSGLSFASGYDLAIQPDGKIIAVGFFQKANGVTRGNIARFNADGSLDTAFAVGSGANSWINALQLQPDGRIVIMGLFSRYNGISQNGVARLLPDGSLDTSFNFASGAQNSINDAIAVQPDGKVILSGAFTAVWGVPRLRFVRLNVDGSLDNSFQPGLGADSNVLKLAIEPDGKCVMTGDFHNLNGMAAPYVARILADNGSAAPDAPASLTASAVSSAQINLSWTNVAWESNYLIEQSPDGTSNWTQIGTASFDVTSFTLGGLAPKTTGFFRVRASSTNGVSAPSPVASATTYTAYQQWKLDNGLAVDALDSGDADGDGLSNLMEYVFGSNPLLASSRNAPAIGVNGSKLEMRYTRARADVGYLVESSTDLLNWTASDVDQGGPGTNVSASTPMNAGAKYLRLRLMMP